MIHRTTLDIYVPAETSLRILCERNGSTHAPYSRPTASDPVARKVVHGVLVEIRRSGAYVSVLLTPRAPEATPEFVARAYRQVLDDFKMLELALL